MNDFTKEIKIGNKNCPKCGSELSNYAGLRSTEYGEEWVEVCNNRCCDFELISPITTIFEVIDE